MQTFFKGGRFELAPEAFGLEELKLPDGEGELPDIWVNFYTYDLDLQHIIELGEIHSLMGGLNYRFFTLSSNYAEEEGLNTYAGFLQYDIRPIHSVIFNLGVRIDHQDYIGTNYSPRGCILFTPLEGHTLRFSVGRAFRNPTYLDSFLDVSASYMRIFQLKIKGNKELDPEDITSYDLGYQANLFDRLRAKLDLFYYDMKKFVNTLGEWIPISPTEGVVTTKNEGEAEGIGGEVGLDYLITPWLSGLINYSYQWIEDKYGNLLAANPRHKANLGLRAALANGISANLLVHYVGATKKSYLISLLPPLEDLLEGPIEPQFGEVNLDPYFLLNASVSYRLLDDRVEVAVSGQNLLDYKNYKDKLYENPGGDPIPLTFFGSLTVRF